MKEPQEYLWIVAKWAGAFALAQFASIPTAVVTMWVFMGLDFMTGIFSSVAIGKPLNSQVGMRGFARKVLVTIMVLLAHLMEKAFGMELGAEKAIAIAYTANEAISIIENCAKGGVPILIPAKAMEVLRQLTQDSPKTLIPDPEKTDQERT